MSILSILTKMTLPTSLLLLAGCQMTDLAENPLGTLKSSSAATKNDESNGAIKETLANILSLKDVVAEATPKINVDASFSKTISAAVKSDPKVQMAKSEVLRQQAKLGVTKSQLDFQFSGTVYAGIEDVTDETSGIAAVLSASRVMYDGGQISNTVLSEEYAVQSALEAYHASLGERALYVGTAWVELERYRSLNALISGRLAVLNPLIKQLEQIADAGVGDATQVAAAERTVAMIRVTQTDIEERLAQAELQFVRLFGSLPNNVTFDAASVSNAVPSKVNDSMAMSAPGLLANYASYLSSLYGLEVAKLRNNMTVGFETKVQRPFGQSGYDSDESVGFVVRKTLYDGGRLASEVLTAQAAVDRQKGVLKDVYRSGRQAVETGMQSISSMEKAIAMAKENAQALSDEIALLRKQLVIGQSTLDSVLSAEARLYDAEAKEINFTADKRTSQLTVLSAIGRLSAVVGIKAENEFK
ncbi:TolC family protein [Paracoccaceae bacterium]|nr:TolC family protein [Paracoccaceae bacterium]